MVVVGLKNLNSNTVKPLWTELWPQNWFWIIKCIFNLWFQLWCSFCSLKKGSEGNFVNKKHLQRQQSWVYFLSWMFQFLTCPAVNPCYVCQWSFWELSCSLQLFQTPVKFPLNTPASHPCWKRAGCRANIYVPSSEMQCCSPWILSCRYCPPDTDPRWGKLRHGRGLQRLPALWHLCLTCSRCPMVRYWELVFFFHVQQVWKVC